ncbi:MAG: molybdate ABC transporter substrate-binding protein [SAR324 cluster bacterium]|uniref:Molybdate ABC transporter substrate-binding protein n=1 Tax=SAR324 cluster bacterium TaxID=2024889 RepID=A0A7X9FNW5_9DELT|nr:molybdate ABC transporter substrate-binding protein [SAR324 cluster bacterium]
MKRKYSFIGFICIAVLLLSACANAATSSESAAQPAPAEVTQASAEKTELLVYSGAGLKSAMEEIKTEFEKNQNVTINYVYAGSAQLLSQIETSGKGDVFIVGSQSAYNVAKEKGFAEESQLVAHHTPVIAVPKGNPANITSLEDLTRSGVRVVLGDPKSNAIGETAQKIFEKNKIEGVDKNVVSLTATVNEILVALKAGNADAAIVTKDGAHGNEADLDLIEIPADQNIDQIIPICVLTSTTNHEMAQEFVDFVASEQGKAIFANHGFAAYNE